MLDYIRDPAEIYRQSFAAIRAEADLSRFPDDVASVVVRMIHTCGQVELAEHIAFTSDVVARTQSALAAGAPVLCDSSMVAAGVTRLSGNLSGNEVVSLVADPRAADREIVALGAEVHVVVFEFCRPVHGDGQGLGQFLLPEHTIRVAARPASAAAFLCVLMPLLPPKNTACGREGRTEWISQVGLGCGRNRP